MHQLADPLSRDQVTVPAGEYVTIRVSDDGCGIAPDKLQKVFEPFFTTKRTGEGTGLGLSTAYGIIKQTGGYIFVDSKEGAGTSFTYTSLFLPSPHNCLARGCYSDTRFMQYCEWRCDSSCRR